MQTLYMEEYSTQVPVCQCKIPSKSRKSRDLSRLLLFTVFAQPTPFFAIAKFCLKKFMSRKKNFLRKKEVENRLPLCYDVESKGA